MSYSNYPEGCTNEDIDRLVDDSTPETRKLYHKVGMFLTRDQVDFLQTLVENHYWEMENPTDEDEKQEAVLVDALKNADYSFKTYD